MYWEGVVHPNENAAGLVLNEKNIFRRFVIRDHTGDLNRDTLANLFRSELAYLPDCGQGRSGVETHRERNQYAENKEEPSQGGAR